MNICRVCMESGEDSGGGGSSDGLIPIFSKLEDAFIANIIVECTSVQILEDDGLPTSICRGCVDCLKGFIRFIRKARESDRKLRKMFKSEGGKRMAEDDEGVDKDWTSAMELSVFTESIMEVKEEMDSDDGKVADDDGNQSETAYEVEYLDDANDSDWKASEDEDEKPVKRGRRRKKVKDSNDSDSDFLVETRKPRRGRKPGRKPKKVDEDDEDYGSEDALDEKELAIFEVIDIKKGQMVCCSCLLIFDTSEELEVHREKHIKKRRVNMSKTNICQICHRRYSTQYALKQHYKRMSEATKIYSCMKCPSRFINQKRRRTHAHNHPREKEVVPSKVLVAPLPEVVHNEYGRICCAQACYQSFETEELLLAHAHTAHKVNKVEQSLDENKDKPIECLVCFKRFYDELSLQRHQQRNYKPLSHQCAVCGLKVRGGEALATHERSHRNEKPFECELCHKNFTSKGSLKAHMMVHSGEKPFVCTTCGWSFRRKRNLQVHILSHSNNQPFQCEICQKTFKSKVHLQYHMRTHTGEKPYPCRYCDKAFADHTNRQRHEMSHTGIKPYKCSYCDKTFIRKRFQVDHESSHTGIKPYRCDMCNRTFSHKTGLRRHLESHPLAPENAIALAAPSPMPAQPSSSSCHMEVASVVDSSMSPPPPPPSMTHMHPGSGYFQHP
nr:oocyte zinc finger protein XlCOF6 [Aedes albopictus]